MADLAGRSSLTSEALGDIVRAAVDGMQNLECHPPADALVLGFIDPPHAASPAEPVDAVAAVDNRSRLELEIVRLGRVHERRRGLGRLAAFGTLRDRIS